METPPSSFHIASLRSVSEEMVHTTRAESFARWVSHYLLREIKPSHVSVALYDSRRNRFPVKISVGRSRMPSGLVAFPSGNAFTDWFRLRPYHRFLVTSTEARQNRQNPVSRKVLEEMKRHRTEICIGIHNRDYLAGYILIGSLDGTGRSFSREDRIFFETLANDIAIEIEKEKYYQLSHFDPLTGLLNRSSLKVEFRSFRERARQKGEEFALAMVDLDFFKKINDQHGHQSGDQVLRIIAQIIGRGIRRSDFAFRYGGEEFLLLLGSSVRNADKPPLKRGEFRCQIIQALERLRRQISARPYECFERLIPVTLSVGVVFSSPEETTSMEFLIEKADRALSISKKEGRNRLTQAA